jgi:hypothetical protein
MGGVVKKVAKVFGIDREEAPDVKIEQAAPAIDTPPEEPKEVDIGTQTTSERRKRRGKSGLRIDLSSAAGGSRGGLNIT